jgi:hypothetical protein
VTFQVTIPPVADKFEFQHPVPVGKHDVGIEVEQADGVWRSVGIVADGARCLVVDNVRYMPYERADAGIEDGIGVVAFETQRIVGLGPTGIIRGCIVSFQEIFMAGTMRPVGSRTPGING